MATNAIAGRQAASGVPLESDDPTLAERTAAFAVAYIRWLETTTDDGLSYPRLRLLGALRCGGPTIMRALADQLGLTARNMTALVDALETEGLVRRRPHPTDRRAVLVEATQAGSELAACALAPRLDAIGKVFDVLTPAERDQFAEMIVRLSAELLSRREEAARRAR